VKNPDHLRRHPCDAVIAVESAVRANISHHWTLSELAAIAHLSHSGLGRQFIKVHGVSPFTWITHQRIREMSRLLSETPQPVRDIAQAVGWSNQAHAAQKFRKLTGRSPTEYRAETRRRIVAECFLCGQALPAPETDGDPRAFDGDPSVHG